MSELFGKKEDQKKILKELIKRLHKGEDIERIREEFKRVLVGLSPVDISMVEEELIKEGIPREEIHKLCDVHLSLLRDLLEKEEVTVFPGHPVYILMEEHKILLDLAQKLKDVAKKIKQENIESMSEEAKDLNNIVNYLKESESHYLREENVLFPYLEKHGVTQPPVIMWMEHDKIREIKKEIYRIFDLWEEMNFEDFSGKLEEKALLLQETLSNHFYKENKILFPTALKVIEEKEWEGVREGFDELGYCCFTPEDAKVPLQKKKAKAKAGIKEKDKILFETGELSRKEIEAIFNNLPVDITFVDREDKVRYFSQTKDRVFPRTKAIIGREVQKCHPQKSVHIVNKILEDFKSGKRDVAEFWINLGERLIYIRYFAVKDRRGDYLGCVEVTQDITEIKKIEGERRIYEEER